MDGTTPQQGLASGASALPPRFLKFPPLRRPLLAVAAATVALMAGYQVTSQIYSSLSSSPPDAVTLARAATSPKTAPKIIG